MTLDLSNVQFSKYDINHDVKIPKRLNADLAYFIGVHLGDGSMGNYNKFNYLLSYTGHLFDEYDFYTKEFYNLFYYLFNKQLNIYKDVRKNKQSIKLSGGSKGIFTFLNSSIGILPGPKINVSIPKLIFNSNSDFITQFIKGYADTDATISFKKRDRNMHYYPVIDISSSSKSLIVQTTKLLSNLDFMPSNSFDNVNVRNGRTHLLHRVHLYGKDNLGLWMEKIGFNSRKHITKYLIWKKFGFCPPHTRLRQRESILKGELDPYSFYKKAPKSL